MLVILSYQQHELQITNQSFWICKDISKTCGNWIKWWIYFATKQLKFTHYSHNLHFFINLLKGPLHCMDFKLLRVDVCCSGWQCLSCPHPVSENMGWRPSSIVSSSFLLMSTLGERLWWLHYWLSASHLEVSAWVPGSWLHPCQPMMLHIFWKCTSGYRISNWFIRSSPTPYLYSSLSDKSENIAWK